MIWKCYRQPGTHPSLEERKEMLQTILDSFTAQKIYTKGLHRFLKPEYEVPIYLKHISKRSAKKGKVPITAAPSSSIIIQGDNATGIRDSIMEIAAVNFDHMKHNYSTHISPEENKGSVSTPSVNKDSVAISSQVSKAPDIIQSQAEVNLEDIKTGLLESMAFTVRVTDTKIQDKKIVTFIFHFIVLLCVHKLQCGI